MEKFLSFRQKMCDQIGTVVVGKEEQIHKVLVAMLCGGHVLLEDVPGLGKTKLARSLAKTMGVDFKRVQFTPDLLPGDLTGIYYFNQEKREFEYRKGPLMTNIVLADEINRATPRTQSALLECMEERQMTVEGNTMELDAPFFVIATQNPVEQFGTFPLPEAQLDRFFVRLSMGYPKKEEELMILDQYQKRDPLELLHCCVTKEEFLQLQKEYVDVFVHPEIKRYMVELCGKTREKESIRLGVSTRGVLALQKGVKANAALNGRNYVIPQDVKDLFVDMMAHRLVLKQTSDQRVQAIKRLEEILREVETPISEDFSR